MIRSTKEQYHRYSYWTRTHEPARGSLEAKHDEIPVLDKTEN